MELISIAIKRNLCPVVRDKVERLTRTALEWWKAEWKKKQLDVPQEQPMSVLTLSLSLARHFLFKTSSGSTPLFSSSSPGYPLTSGTVYTPPPRLLPRNTFSRKAFKLKKPSKYCSWKCAALSAIAAALLLAILLAYFIGKSRQPTPWPWPWGGGAEAVGLWMETPSLVCTVCLLAPERWKQWWGRECFLSPEMCFNLMSFFLKIVNTIYQTCK